MRKEIEVKAKVKNIHEISRKLEDLGCILPKSITQHDVIFVDNKYGKFDKFQPGKNLLRIRGIDKKFIFTIKQPQSNEQDSIEYETEITDPKGMKEALLLMGYHEAIQVHKKRIKTKIYGWEISLDEVEGLGSFIEVEKIGENLNVEATQKELFDFLKKLGIKLKDRIISGYDTMIFKRKN